MGLGQCDSAMATVWPLDGDSAITLQCDDDIATMPWRQSDNAIVRWRQRDSYIALSRYRTISNALSYCRHRIIALSHCLHRIVALSIIALSHCRLSRYRIVDYRLPVHILTLVHQVYVPAIVIVSKKNLLYRKAIVNSAIDDSAITRWWQCDNATMRWRKCAGPTMLTLVVGWIPSNRCRNLFKKTPSSLECVQAEKRSVFLKTGLKGSVFCIVLHIIDAASHWVLS